MYAEFKHTNESDIIAGVEARWEVRILERIAEAPTNSRGELLTEEQIRSNFSVRIAGSIERRLSRYNRGLYAFIEAPVSFLNVRDEGMRMHRYLTHWVISNEGTMCLILLSPKTRPYGRHLRVTQATMKEMETKFDRLGYDRSTWLTKAEYKTRINSPDYIQEGI